MSEKTVDQLLAEGNRREAVKQLYEMIVAAADQRDFTRAEALRLKLLATDDMALAEIIGSAEVIEAAKSAAIDSSYHELWQELCATLTEEENNALYFAQQEVTLKPGQAFIEQNKLNNRLFFVLKGVANIVCRHGERQVFFHQVKAGDIVGEDTFFGISVCTTSIICQGSVTVRFLNRQSLDEWRESLPGLEEKLRSYCWQRRLLDHAQVSGKVDRRQDKRHHFEAELSVQLQNLKGENIGGAFRGVLDDVSAGGVCFYVKSASRSTARMLLGRPVRLTFSRQKVVITLQGVIVSSKFHFQNEFTVHVKLISDITPLYRQLLAGLESGGT